VTAGPELTPRIEDSFELSDGRKIGYAEYGAPNGRGVFWFHGTPGARRQMPPAIASLAQERDVRLVTLERPGVGTSTRFAYRNVREWSHDVEEIADGLGFDRFGLIALSGGGPYLLGCAYELPERVAAGVVLGGVAPSRGPEAVPGGLVGMLTRVGPLLDFSKFPLGLTAWTLIRVLEPIKSPAFDLYARLSPPGDRELLRRPGFKAMFLDDLMRGTRRQCHAVVCDAVLFTREWGFPVSHIKVPIAFWHGDKDNIVPLSHARHVASLVPRSSLRVRSGESHMGAMDAPEEILDTLLALWDAPPARVDSAPGEVARRAIGRADFGSAGA
jgi:pimeloyl-ACP methyl ester carboxylesterase